ncbi:MAG: bifunctional alpha/beta hydrolase/OsmC family protein [Myxococcota bacterium]
MQTERIKFDNGRGHALAARLDRPLRDIPRGYAIFAHCFTCSKNLGAVVALSRALVDRGWAVLRFDFTGLGDSEGDFSDTHFSSNVDDLVAAGKWLAEHRTAARVLIGHSLGGAAVLRAAAELDSVVAVATVGAPSHPEHVAKMLTCEREQIERDGEAEVELAGRRFKIRKEFLEDIEEQPMRAAIRGLKRALLVMHAPRDEVVGIENASGIFEAARHPKSFVSLDDADHLLTRPSDAHFAASIIASWAERYLPEADHVAGDPERVVAWGPSRGFRTELAVGDHVLVGDEPVDFGGTDKGPSPYGFLQAALGACTVMTLRMYADRKKWPLTQAVARLSHGKIHAKDCEDCEDGTKGRVDRIDRIIELRGDDLTDEQRARLLEIADKCPVHKTLTHGTVSIVTKPGS